MASLQRINGYFHISFRCSGQRFKRSLKTKSHPRALARKARLEETIDLVENGRLDLPDDVDVAAYLLRDGKARRKGNGNNGEAPTTPLSLKDVFAKFFASIPKGNLEDTTLDGMHKHERHLIRVLGSTFPLGTLTSEHLQQYVNTLFSKGRWSHSFCRRPNYVIAAASVL